ncbi:BTAD domain-containing putative transcriptional regulator [Micromonospora sp. LOL_025]|uniref:AfsR/SARP family transcriptional regulator n=1 Tax=Micromonospora sp. LOL_025 TaxID=3345413 RepID=UPI003A897AD9
MTMPLRFTVLGPVGVTANGRPVCVDRPRRRAVLAYLLLHGNQVVSVDQLIPAIWGGTPPSTARAQIQAEISALRHTLRRAGCPTGSIHTRPGGYLFELAADQLDLTTYTGMVELSREDRTRGRLEAARKLMREALALWRGTVLSGAVADFVEPNRERLEERRLADVEWLVDLELLLGQHHEVTAELTRYVAEYPLRERLRAQLMVALYRAGRQPEALELAREGRRIVAETHGLDPGVRLRELELAILRQDPSLNLTGSATVRPEGGGDVADVPDVTMPGARDGRLCPAQLPAAPPVFAGRDGELASLVTCLGSRPGRPPQAAAPRLVLLSGMPGVGKSALALRAAHAVTGEYPDGQLYVDLGGGRTRRAGPVLAGFLRALGVTTAAMPSAPAERAALFRSIVAERRILLLLDDVSSVEQVQPLIPAAAGCAVVVTSRQQLDLAGACRHVVAPLTEEQGVAVLTGYLGTGRVAAEPTAVGQLLRACGGLPLALRIASSRLQTGRWIADLVTLLRDPRHRLDELSADQATMRGSLESSYRLLSPPAQLTLRRIAMLPTPSVPDWAPAVCARLTPRAAARALDELVQFHLLTVQPRDEPGPNRYVLHDLVRWYALTSTADEPPESAPARASADPGACGWGVLAWEAARRSGAPAVRPVTALPAGHLFPPEELGSSPTR